MRNTLDDVAKSLLKGDFFVHRIRSASNDEKERLARTLLLYESRGRPVHSNDEELKRFEADWNNWRDRPQLPLAIEQVERLLSRFSAKPYVSGSLVLSNPKLFPGVYWGTRWTCASCWEYVKNVIDRFHGVRNRVRLPATQLKRYRELSRYPEDGHAVMDRARLIAYQNNADTPTHLPGAALVAPPVF